MQYDVIFYVAYPYYFPHFLPIEVVLKKEGLSVHFVLSNEQNTDLMLQIAKKNSLDYTLGKDALKILDAKVIFFANVPDVNLQIKAKKVFLCHGTGTKQCGFENALERCDIVFVEGTYRYEYYTKMFSQYKNKIKKVGYSKLDPLFDIQDIQVTKLKEKYNLDSSKKTILYAPTFFPSSIEKMDDNFPKDFKEYNILVKPHYLSWERKRYAKQRKKFEAWSKYDNCHIYMSKEYDLVPFLMMADVMISDESSAIFEFASLNKPVIINRFLKLRWSYYLNPKKLFNRMDKNMNRYRVLGENPTSYKEMLYVTKKALADNSAFEEARLSLAKDVCGKLDGKASLRIVEVVKDLCVNP